MKKILTFFALSSFYTVFSQITINANFPSNINSASSVEADVKIVKGSVGNFAKYQLDVPSGYVISSVDAKNGNFTFENQRAKIVWVSVPSEQEFTIKLKIQANSDAVSPAIFAQKFYYLENNEKKEVEAAPITIIVGGVIAVANTPVETKTVEPVVTEIKTTPTPTETKTVAPVVTETKTTPVVAKSVETKTTISSSVEAGVTFKVQIGAYSSQPSKSKFPGAGNVSIDLINGMYKVTTGNFKTKEEAVKYRDELQSKGYSGFITRYKDGVRIN